MDNIENNPQSPEPKNSNTGIIIGVVVVLALIVGGVIYSKNSGSSEEVEGTQTQNTQTDSNGDGNMQDGNVASPTPTPSTSSGSATPTPTPSATSQSAVKTFTVEGSNFKFSPTQIKVNKGDTVKIVFNNTGGFHDFVIDEFNVKTKQISGGASETVSFVADKTGTFEYYCSVGSHRAMGMVGKLIVE